MTYLIIVGVCLVALSCIAALYCTGHMPFNHKPLAFLIGMVGFFSFYMANDNGEIHVLSERIARVIVKIVQVVVHLAG